MQSWTGGESEFQQIYESIGRGNSAAIVQILQQFNLLQLHSWAMIARILSECPPVEDHPSLTSFQIHSSRWVLVHSCALNCSGSSCCFHHDVKGLFQRIQQWSMVWYFQGIQAVFLKECNVLGWYQLVVLGYGLIWEVVLLFRFWRVSFGLIFSGRWGSRVS